MPTIIQTTQGTVTGLWGSAIVKGADGRAHPLKMGDIVRRGDVILTSQDGIVQLTSDVQVAAPVDATATADAATAPTTAEAPPKVTATRNEVDQVIENLAQNDADAATAAGLAGGEGGEFLPGLRVDRITETLTPLGLVNGQEDDTNNTLPLGEPAASAAELANIAPSALDGSVSGPENATLPVALRGVDSDGNVVSVTVTSVPTGGTLLLADGITVVGTGQTLTPAQAAGLLFKPAVDFVGQATISFFVTDNQGSTSNGGTVSLNLVDTSPPPPTNQAPVGVNDSATTPEDTPATGNVLGNDSDPDGDALTVTQFSLGGITYAAGDTAVLAGVGQLTLAANGAYTFSPETNYNGPVPVATYTVSDGIASVTATLTLSVSAVNDAPVAQNDLASTPVNEPTTVAVLANDSDVDGNALTVTSASVDPALGTVTVNPNGTLTFNPANNVSGPVVIQYAISDGQGGTANATVTVNIGPNTPPDGTDATVTIAEDGTRSFSAADFGFSDADAGQSFANLRIDTLPAVGSLTLSGIAVAAGQVISVADLGNLVFTPTPNTSGTGYASFGFSVQDSAGAFDTALNQITIDVSPVNDAPLAVATPASGSEDAAGIPVLLSGSDIDGSIASFTITSLPANGVLLFSGVAVTLGQSIPATAGAATLSFVPVANFNGTTAFDFTTTDNEGAVSPSVSAPIAVTPVNDAPVAVDDLAATPINTGTTISVLANDSDVDGNALTVTAASVDPARGTVTINPDGTLAFTPAGNISGPVLVSYTVSDGQGGFASATVTVNVGPNTPPTGTNALVVIDEDGSRSFNATDFGFSDADAGQSFANVRIDVLPAAGNLTLSGVAVAAGQVIAVADLGNLVYSPAPNANGSGYASFSFSVQDSGGAFDTAPNQITIDVTPAADAAVIGGVTSSATVEDTILSTGGTLTVTDPDAGEAAFNPRTNVAGAHGTFNIDAAGVWTYQLNNADPAVQALGAGQSLPNETFTVTSIDGTSQVVTVTITGTNDAPVAQAASAAVDEDAPLFSGTVNATDVDANAALSFSLNAAPPPGLTFNPNGSYTFDASNAAYQALAAGQQQVLTIPYTVTDDQGATSIANLVITVTGTDDAAVIGGVATGSVTEDGVPVASGTLTAIDVDSPTGFVASAATGTYGDFSIDAAGTWSYTLRNADANVQALSSAQHPIESFTVTALDGTTSTVTVTVNGANEAPVAIVTPASGNEDAPGIPVLLGGSDVDGSIASFTIGSLPANGVLLFGGVPVTLGQSIPATAGVVTLSFVPATNFNGNTSFDFTATDNEGAVSPPVNAPISMVAVADAAVIGGVASGATVEDTTLSTGGTLTVTDPDAGEAAFNPLTNVAGSHGTFNIDAAGVWTYQLNNADPAVQTLGAGQTLPNETFTVTSIDGTSQVVTVTITGTNDAPIAQAASFSVAEDAPLVSGSVVATDVDANASLTFALNGTAPAGLTFNADGSYSFNAASSAYQSLGVGQSAILTVPYTVTDDQGATSVANLVITVTGTNDAPIARSDVGSVLAAQTLIVSGAEGVIQSTSVPAGRDTDIEGDVLTVTKISAGPGVPTTVVPNGGSVTIAGTYGDLQLRNDGSYQYTASRADAVAAGTQVNDVFSYQVSDGNGGFATALLTVRVGGAADTLAAAPPTTTALTSTLGLNGEYYGYNDFNPGPTSPNRRHADDGVYGNLDRAADVTSIVNGRNAAFTAPGTPGIVGTSTAAAADAADARFIARAIDYGTSPTVTGTLGTNPNIAAGGSTAGLTNDNSQLFKFLNRSGGGDASTITVGRGTGDNDQIGGGPTSGLGRTSDVAIRLTGQAYLAAGLYDIRVYADDGFRLRLDDQTVAAFNDIQSPTTRVYTGVPIDGGLTPLELLYWEQGGNAVLRVEFKLSGTPDSAYQVLGSQNLPLFSDANAPVLSDLQDLVAGPTPGSYLVRTGSLLDGGNGDDTLTGSAGRDILVGGQGKDTLSGGAGDDLIRGGAGNDQLTGGAGHDVFSWSLGDAGTAGTPARDVITDFDNTPHGGDVLDLRDLLVGESHAANAVALPASIGLNNALTITPNEGNLANYLHFSAVGGNTVVEISSTGGFASSYTPAAVDQVITLTGLNLVGSFTNDHQVINDLLQRGKLVTD